MDPQVSLVTNILAVLAVVGAVGIIVVVAAPRLLFGRAYEAAFLVSAFGAAASLYYSEIAGFLPCALCWWQRIFLYPIPVMLAASWYARERVIGKYLVVLAVLGAAVAAYNAYLQFGGAPLAACGAPIGAVSCSKKYFEVFGFITMPVMSFIAFTLIVALLWPRKSNF